MLHRWADDRPATASVFATSTGTPILGPNFRRAVRWSATAPGHRVHDLRHTAATIWLSSGLDPLTVQHWLGHATATLTLDLYGHFMGDDASQAAVNRLTATLHPASPATDRPTAA